MDTGSFVASAKKAESTVGTLASRMGISGATIGKAATAIGGALAATFTVEKIHSALQYADAMGKMAQSAGVTTEQFSALAFAASLSEVSIEELGQASARFNRNIAEATTGTTDAARAFQIMGISLKDGGGNLRNMSDLLGDVADRFSKYADGANKTALAQELFGKSGARLIPLLNAGRDGIEDLKKEAKDLGVVISDVDAKKAEAFNDALTRMAAASRGLAKDIGLLVAGPATSFLEWLAKVSAFGKSGVSDLNKAMNLKALNDDILLARKQIEALAGQKARMMAGGKGEADPELAQVNRDLDAAIKKFDALSSAKRRSGIGEFETSVKMNNEAPNLAEQAMKDAQAAAEVTRLANEAIGLNQERVAQYGEVLAGLQTPMDSYRQKLEEISQASMAGMVDTQKLSAASLQAWASMQAGVAQVAGNLTGALSDLFKQNKAFAYANALISTYEAVTRALANPPGPPFSYVNAAAAAIKGMAQVRAIASTNPGSSGAPPAAGGGEAAAPVAAAAPSRRVLEVAGLSAGKFVRGEVMNDIVQGLLEYQRDGGEVVLR
jgi:ribosomal protein L12E/L44/L45/RPP1/RPP2